MEIIQEERVGYTVQVPIYHGDGTYLVKVVKNRLNTTPEGAKAGIKIDKRQGVAACMMKAEIPSS